MAINFRIRGSSFLLQGPSGDAFSAALGTNSFGQDSWSGNLGSMGQDSTGHQMPQSAPTGDSWDMGDDDEDATPLLQELEIYPEHIREKTLEVLNPARPIKDEYLQDADLAGPLVFCLILGVCLLFVSIAASRILKQGELNFCRRGKCTLGTFIALVLWAVLACGWY